MRLRSRAWASWRGWLTNFSNTRSTRKMLMDTIPSDVLCAVSDDRDVKIRSTNWSKRFGKNCVLVTKELVFAAQTITTSIKDTVCWFWLYHNTKVSRRANPSRKEEMLPACSLCKALPLRRRDAFYATLESLQIWKRIFWKSLRQSVSLWKSSNWGCYGKVLKP